MTLVAIVEGDLIDFKGLFIGINIFTRAVGHELRFRLRSFCCFSLCDCPDKLILVT